MTDRGGSGRSRRWWRLLLLVPLVALLAAVTLAAWAWQTVHRPFRGYSTPQVTVELEPGLGARQILERLAARGVLADARLARLWLVHALGDPPLKGGEYSFSRPMSTPQVLEKLVRGEIVMHRVTLVEGLTLDEAAAALAAAGFGETADLQREMGRPDAVRDLDPQATNLEGYLFPDTYHFARGMPASEVISTLVRNFRRRYAEILAGLAPTGDRTLREVVTLASIVEKEARLDEERAIIAGVYANRLRQGIALYADPTVIYALRLLGRWDGNLRRPDLKLDSPYNTYLHPGLPPGPICSPGAASLAAAVAPADVPYLYFVSRNDGSHVFARTLAEHNRNVALWQKQYWRERWARERNQAAAEGQP